MYGNAWEHNAEKEPISALMVREQLVTALRLSYEVDEWRMHPAQVVMIMNLYTDAHFQNFVEVTAPVNSGMVSLHPHTLMARTITEDIKMASDEILAFWKGQEVFRIDNLATPQF